MTFNSVKLELMRYGKDDQLKDSANYITPELKQIKTKEAIKDLGITLQNYLSFKQHIANIAEVAKRMPA